MAGWIWPMTCSLPTAGLMCKGFTMYSNPTFGEVKVQKGSWKITDKLPINLKPKHFQPPKGTAKGKLMETSWDVVVLRGALGSSAFQLSSSLPTLWGSHSIIPSSQLPPDNGEHAKTKEFHAAAAAKSRQSCPTLCDPIDSSPAGSSVHGILQARTLEWVAISSSNAWKWKVKVKSLSRVRIPWVWANCLSSFAVKTVSGQNWRYVEYLGGG